jgi:hypothetical protein
VGATRNRITGINPRQIKYLHLPNKITVSVDALVVAGGLLHGGANSYPTANVGRLTGRPFHFRV